MEALLARHAAGVERLPLPLVVKPPSPETPPACAPD